MERIELPYLPSKKNIRNFLLTVTVVGAFGIYSTLGSGWLIPMIVFQGLFFLMGILWLLNRLRGTGRLIVDETGLELTKGSMGGANKIAFADITRVKLDKNNTGPHMTLSRPSGIPFRVMGSFLPSDSDYTNVVKQLRERTPTAQWS